MRFTLFLALTLLSFPNLSASDGIQFEQGSWEAILAKAKAEDKIIFLDAYASWCGPCKMMDRDVFSQKEAAKFYNKHFINARIDMEKGEGKTLSDKYEVQAYPSLLFIDGSGELVHRAVGYHDVEAFIELGERALDPSLRLSGMAARYAKGERSPEFLYDYAMASRAAMSPHAEAITKAYLKAQRNWGDAATMQLIFETAETAESELFDFILERRADFELLYGEQAVAYRIQELIFNSLEPDDTEEETFAKVDKLFQRAYPEDAARISTSFRMNYYRMARQMGKFVETALDYYENYDEGGSEELNYAAWSFYLYVDEPEMLEKALEWAKRSVAMEDGYANNDTLAALYYKLGRKKEAIKAAEHAIELAKAEGSDYSETEQLLEMIRELNDR